MKRDLIYEPVNDKICNKGFANVTMQMVADELTMSKKTLYKHFENKEGLISYILSERNKAYQLKWDFLKTQDQNIVELTWEMRRYVTEKGNFQKQHNNLMELSALYPEIYEVYLNELRATIENCIEDMVVLGQKQGLYIDLLDKSFVAKFVTFFYIESRLLRNLKLAEKDFDKFSLLFYFLTIRGALTPKGQKQFQKFEAEMQERNMFKIKMD